jgi:hypothetical protein
VLLGLGKYNLAEKICLEGLHFYPNSNVLIINLLRAKQNNLLQL